MAIQFITGNKVKFSEAEQILGSGVIEQLDIDLPEIQDLDAKVILEHKLKAAFEHHHGEFIVEDTSLYFDCFEGKLPGPLIKWFLKSLSPAGLANLTSKMGNSAATAQTLIGYAKSPIEIYYFEGSVEGSIVAPRGEGFGWDPAFEVEGTGKTFGEMTKEEKNTISHRFRAVSKLKELLNNRP